jgi:hypothetical protein
MFMKKLYVFMTALLAMFAINANAERILYQETYEVGGVPSTWTNDGCVLGIATPEGQSTLLQISNGNQRGGRTAHDFWGKSIFDGVTESEYSLSFEVRFDNLSANQYNGEIAVYSDETGSYMINGSVEGKGKVWATYAEQKNCLFSLNQTNTADDKGKWKINNDENKIFSPNVGSSPTWYLVTLTVNTTTKEVAYEIFDYDTSNAVATGSKTMGEDENIFATGLYIMAARYTEQYSIDNLKIFLDVEYANKPIIALAGLKDSERTYMITFLEGETLHVKGTDGQEQTVSYDDVEEGNFFYKTTTSGTLTAWTTAGTMKSEETTVEVDCSPVVLPIPTYAVVGADEGYAKTYQFSIDNKNVPLQPTIYMDFVFEGEGGQGSFTLDNQTSGAKVEVPGKGTLKITTKALGFASSTSSIVNDIEYEIKHDIDFQHMTGAELAEKGFAAIDDLNSVSMSGENSWTGRLRMYFSIGSDNYPVYGFTESADNYDATVKGYTDAGAKQETPVYAFLDGRGYADFSTAESIKRHLLVPSKLTEEAAKTMFAPLKLWNTAAEPAEGAALGDDVPAVKFNEGIGLICTGVKGDAQSGSIAVENATLSFDGLTDDDLVVVSKINGYGAGSLHPQFAAGTDLATAKAEYKASHIGGVLSTVKGTETFQLYRIDTALSRILVLSAKNGTGIDNMNYNKVVSDANAPVYNLNGVKMNPNALTKGIYVKQGKKFVVK